MQFLVNDAGYRAASLRRALYKCAKPELDLSRSVIGEDLYYFYAGSGSWEGVEQELKSQIDRSRKLARTNATSLTLEIKVLERYMRLLQRHVGNVTSKDLVTYTEGVEMALNRLKAAGGGRPDTFREDIAHYSALVEAGHELIKDCGMGDPVGDLGKPTVDDEDSAIAISEMVCFPDTSATSRNCHSLFCSQF